MKKHNQTEDLLGGTIRGLFFGGTYELLGERQWEQLWEQLRYPLADQLCYEIRDPLRGMLEDQPIEEA